MSIPKKGARTIIADGEIYKWLIRRKATYNQTDYGTGHVHVAIEHDSKPNTSLVIYTDRKHPKDWSVNNPIGILPSDISKWIKQALELGWKPKIKGVQFLVKLECEDMMKAN